MPPPRSVYGPIGRADAPVLQAQQRAQRRTQGARRAVERRTSVPYVPKISHPNPAQRLAAQQAAHRAYESGIRTRADINALPPAQRRRVNRALGYLQTQRRNQQISVATHQYVPPPLPPGYRYGDDGGILQRVHNPFTGANDWLPADAYANGVFGTARTLHDVSGPIRRRGRRLYEQNVVEPQRRAFLDQVEHIQTHVPPAQQARLLADLVGRSSPKQSTRRELAAEGRAIMRAHRSQIKPGDGHQRVELAGFLPTIDVSAIRGAVGDALGHDAEGNFAKGALSDIGSIATSPFVGGIAIGKGTYDLLRHGDPSELGALASGTLHGLTHGFAGEALQGHWAQAAEQLRHHPVFAGLDVAAGVGTAGRVAGALARGAGSEAAAGGLRGALARTGSTVRPPLALTEDAAAARGGLVHERAYSKDLSRKAAQVAADRRMEPLRDEHGQIVTVKQRGRRVPVLKPSARVREQLLRRRTDFAASRANSVERLDREQAAREAHQARPRSRPGGRLANELVSMAMEGTLRRPETLVEDLRAHRARLEEAAQRGEFRHQGELSANRERAAFIDRVLASPRALSQAREIFAAARRQATHLNAREREAIDLGLLDKHAAERSKLIPYAIEHMGARHVSAEEHAQLEAEQRALERVVIDGHAGAPGLRHLPAGHGDRAELKRNLQQLRGQRIAVSGRDPKGVHAHEQSRAAHGAAERRAKLAEVKVAQLERSRQRLVGAQSVQRGSAAAQRMDIARSAPRRSQAVLRHIDRAEADPSGLAKGAAKEQQRARVLAKVEAQLTAARGEAKAARAAERVARHRLATSPLPPIREGVRASDGRMLSNEEIRAHMAQHGTPTAIAYLPHRLDVRGGRSHHTQFRLGTRPVLDKEQRTGEAYRRGSTAFGQDLVHDEYARKAVQVAKAEQLDRFVEEHGLRHPAWKKAAAGADLTNAEKRIVQRGGYFTGKEATELAQRIERDTGERFVPVRAFGAKVSREVQQSIQEELQQPRAFESLGQRLLNDRIVRPSDGNVDTRARNVVLVPAGQVERLDEHLRPAGNIKRFFQFMNRPFRLSVLSQPRWLTGQAFEPFAVRLTASGSGLNVFGLAADVRAAVKVVRRMERSTDPKLRQAAREIRSQQFGGLLIGGRGAGVRRTAEDLPGVLKTAAVVRHLPVVKQLGDFAGELAHSFFRANRVIEGVAQRAALGRSVREDIQAFTGSWLETVRLGERAAQEAAQGLLRTPTQERFMRAQHQLLGQYSEYSPVVRDLVQTAFPFAPWAAAAARFSFWTMPAHHTVLTDLLLKTEQTIDQEWQQQHADVPPGVLELALPTKAGGFVDLARYSPYGLSGAVVGGDLQAITDQAFPQLTGVVAAIEGRDPFGRDLQLHPTPSNPQGKAGTGGKVGVAVNQLVESLVPFVGMARRLQEGGGTAYADSTVFSPKVKPNTSHGMSAVRRTLDPFRPTYLHSGGGSGGPTGAPPGINKREFELLLREARAAESAGAATDDEQRKLLREARLYAGG